MDGIKKDTLMDMETSRELKTYLPRNWKPGKSGEVSINHVSYLESDSEMMEQREAKCFCKSDYTGGIDRLKETEKHLRMREIERLADIARQQQKYQVTEKLGDTERHELRMSEMKKFVSVEWKRDKELEISSNMEIVRQVREGIHEKQKIVERQQNEMVIQSGTERMMIKDLEDRQNQMEKQVKEMQCKFSEEREMARKKHEESLCHFEQKYQQMWKVKMMELEQNLEKEKQIREQRERELLKLIEQDCKNEMSELAKKHSKMEINKHMESLRETPMAKNTDLEGELKQLAKENSSEAILCERQNVVIEEEMTDIEPEKGTIRGQERQLQEQLEKIERKIETEKEMKQKRHEERCVCEERPKELGRKMEEEGKAEQKKVQVTLKQEGKIAKEVLKIERQKEIEVENKITTGEKKLIDKGKEWMREIKQIVKQKKDSASLPDGEQTLDDVKVQSKNYQKEGKSMAEKETPVKGKEWLREFRSKDEKLTDAEKRRETTTIKMQMEVEKEQDQLVGGWFGEIDKKRSKKTFSAIKKTHQEAEEMLRKENEITMEGKTKADQQQQQQPRMEVTKSQETTKTGTLKKEAMEWLEETQQNVKERKHIEKEVPQMQVPQTKHGEYVRNTRTGQCRRVRMSEMQMEEEQMERNTKLDDWVGEMEREREKKQKPCEKWNEFVQTHQRRKGNTQQFTKNGNKKQQTLVVEERKREVEKKQGEAGNDWIEEMNDNRGENRWTHIKNKRQEAEEMLRKASETSMENKTSTDQQEKRMIIMKTRETIKTEALSKEGMEWLEEIEQNVTEKKHSERELKQGQQITVRARRERVHDIKMEGQQVKGVTKFNALFKDMGRDCQSEKEQRQKPSEYNWIEVADQRRKVDKTQEFTRDEEVKRRDKLPNQRVTAQNTSEQGPVNMGSYSQNERTWKQEYLKHNTDKVFKEKFGIMNEKQNSEEKVIRNRRQMEEEERKGDTKQLKKEALLDWLRETEQKTTDKRMQEPRQQCKSMLEEKKREMEEDGKEKERKVKKKQEIRQREVEQKAKMVKLLLNDIESEPEEKEVMLHENINRRKSNRNDRVISESEKQTEIVTGNAPRRLSQKIPFEFVKTTEKNKDLQTDNEMQHNIGRWQRSSRLLEMEKDKEKQRTWKREWEEEMSKQKELDIHQQKAEKSRPSNDRRKVSYQDKHNETGMETGLRRQQLSQNWATSDIKTTKTTKADENTELKTDRELMHDGWLKSSKLLEIEQDKEKQKNWEMEKKSEWDERQKERQRQLATKRDDQERQKTMELEIETQKELEQQREVAREREAERSTKHSTERKQGLEEQIQMEKQREMGREKELLRDRDKERYKKRGKQRTHEFNLWKQEEENRAKMARMASTQNKEKPAVTGQLVQKSLIQSQDEVKDDPNFCEVLDIELDGEDIGIIPFLGRVIPKSEVEEARRHSEESTSKKARIREIEMPQKTKLAFMRHEDEQYQTTTEQYQETTEQEILQETTEQELPQGNVTLPEALTATPAMTTGKEERTEGQVEVDEEQLENTSPCLDDCNATEEAGNAAQRDKSIRRRIFNWANDKAKAYYEKKIQRTIVREEEEGQNLYLRRMGHDMSRAEREQNKRSAYQKAEKRRQIVEKFWQNWQTKKAENKQKAKVEKEAFQKALSEEVAIYARFPGMNYALPGIMFMVCTFFFF